MLDIFCVAMVTCVLDAGPNKVVQSVIYHTLNMSGVQAFSASLSTSGSKIFVRPEGSDLGSDLNMRSLLFQQGCKAYVQIPW